MSVVPLPTKIPTAFLKGLSGAACASIASVAVDSVKTAYKLAKGELSAKEALAEIQDNAVATAGGIALSVKGAAVGAAVGSVLGPIGTAVGGIAGSVLGFAAGSTLGKVVSQGFRKICEKGEKLIESTVSKVADVAKSVGSAIKSGVRGILDFIF